MFTRGKEILVTQAKNAFASCTKYWIRKTCARVKYYFESSVFYVVSFYKAARNDSVWLHPPIKADRIKAFI